MSATNNDSSGLGYSTIPLDNEELLEADTAVAARRFVIRERIGRGGMGIVYRAEDRHDSDRSVALKVVRARQVGSDTEARYHNEARLGANLEGHPNFVRALAVGTLDGPDGFAGRMYLATEFVQGDPLDVLIARHRAGVPLVLGISIALDVARALAHLHARGIVHRDIKPNNVLVVPSGNPETTSAKLIDFGLAYCTGDGWETKSPDLTEDGQIPGTLLYMSPQQVAHERPAPAFDIYAFGTMLYEMFAGGAPNDRVPARELYIRKCDPNWRIYPLTKVCSELPAALTSAVDRCLSYQPDGRPSAADLVELLEQIGQQTNSGASVIPLHPRQTGEVVRAREAVDKSGAATATPSKTTEPAQRRGRAAVPMLVALIASIGAGAWVWSASSANDLPESSAKTPDAVQRVPESRATTDANGGIVTEPVPSKLETKLPDPSKRRTTPVPATTSTDPPQTKPTKTTAPRTDKSPPKRKRPASIPETPCDGVVDEAQTSARTGQAWATVSRLTASPQCWKGQSLLRMQLRTRAMLEQGRYDQCIRVGSKSNDPAVNRWVAVCQRKLQGED